jgi:hypothetical protein
LRHSAPGRESGEAVDADGEAQSNGLSRLLIGIFLAEGLALGLRMLFDARLFSWSRVDVASDWSSLLDVIAVQALQATCVLIAGILTGAGRRRGFLLGAVVGLASNMIQFGIQLSSGEQLTEIVLYGQPLLYTACGALGGALGSLIWRPLPVVHMALPLRRRPGVKRPPRFPVFAGPVAWPRVIIGASLAVAGVLSASLVLNFAVATAKGDLQITSQMQSQMITWEIGGLAVLAGAVFAGTNRFNGLKQGLCVGIGASLIVASVRLSDRTVLPEELIATAVVILGLSLFGGWFGCRLFPPIVSTRRHRGIIDAP